MKVPASSKARLLGVPLTWAMFVQLASLAAGYFYIFVAAVLWISLPVVFVFTRNTLFEEWGLEDFSLSYLISLLLFGLFFFLISGLFT